MLLLLILHHRLLLLCLRLCLRVLLLLLMLGCEVLLGVVLLHQRGTQLSGGVVGAGVVGGGRIPVRRGTGSTFDEAAWDGNSRHHLADLPSYQTEGPVS